MDKEKSEAAQRLFWRRTIPLWILFGLLGYILLGILHAAGILHRVDTAVSQLIVWVSLLIAATFGAKAVRRAGLSLEKVNRTLLSSPRPHVDLPALKIRSDKQTWGQLAILFGFLCALGLIVFIMNPGEPTELGYVMVGICGCISLVSAVLWKRNGYLLAHIDSEHVIVGSGSKKKQVPWSEIQHCEVARTHDIFGRPILTKLRFLGSEGQERATTTLKDASTSILDRERFLLILRSWFTEETENAGETMFLPTVTPVSPTTVVVSEETQPALLTQK